MTFLNENNDLFKSLHAHSSSNMGELDASFQSLLDDTNIDTQNNGDAATSMPATVTTNTNVAAKKRNALPPIELSDNDKVVLPVLLDPATTTTFNNTSMLLHSNSGLAQFTLPSSTIAGCVQFPTNQVTMQDVDAPFPSSFLLDSHPLISPCLNTSHWESLLSPSIVNHFAVTVNNNSSSNGMASGNNTTFSPIIPSSFNTDRAECKTFDSAVDSGSNNLLPQHMGSCDDNVFETSNFTASATQSQNVVVEEADGKQQQNADSDRAWYTVYRQPNLSAEDEVSITCKTRCEKPANSVPDKIYSSLKYELGMTTSSAFGLSLPYVHSRCVLLDATTMKQVEKEKPVMKGTTEGALFKPTQGKGAMSGTLKVQINSEVQLSYHHIRKELLWQISFFTPTDQVNPFLIKRSAPFRVYARKPTVMESTTETTQQQQSALPSTAKKKRSRDEEPPPAASVALTNTTSTTTKKTKKSAKSAADTGVLHIQAASAATMAEFESKLVSLVQYFSSKLTSDERKMAVQLAMSKLMSIPDQQPTADVESSNSMQMDQPTKPVVSATASPSSQAKGPAPFVISADSLLPTTNAGMLPINNQPVAAHAGHYPTSFYVPYFFPTTQKQ